MNKSLLLSFLLCCATYLAQGDGILLAWGPDNIIGLTEEQFKAAKDWDVATIAARSRDVKSWADAYLLVVAASMHKDSATDLLIEQLSDAREAGLSNTSRLIIWERIISGDIQFEGKGFQVDDDLFSVAGRANWVLRQITRKNFGYIKPHTDATERAALKARWVAWRAGENPGAYLDPYATDVKAMDEVNSPQALEAIILSLQASAWKDALVSDCVRNIYKIDKMPEGDSPARFCNPDNYSVSYLTHLTGIGGQHDYSWWAAWWDKNRAKLKWNRENARFDLQ